MPDKPTILTTLALTLAITQAQAQEHTPNCAHVTTIVNERNITYREELIYGGRTADDKFSFFLMGHPGINTWSLIEVDNETLLACVFSIGHDLEKFND